MYPAYLNTNSMYNRLMVCRLVLFYCNINNIHVLKIHVPLPTCSIKYSVAVLTTTVDCRLK